MAGLTRSIHVTSNFKFDSIDVIAPDVGLRFQINDPERQNGSGPEEIVPKALWFVDPDGETHVYPLAEEARQELIRALSGGIVVAGAGDIVDPKGTK